MLIYRAIFLSATFLPVSGRGGTLLLAACGILGTAWPAGAVSIVNLDTTPHQLAISPMPGQVEVIELAPGRILRRHAPRVTLRLLDGTTRRDIRARSQDEYVIWPGGEMSIQKRRRSKGRVSF